MSNFNYIVLLDADKNVVFIRKQDDPGYVPVLWTDPDFQAWNAAQPTPYVLSQAQIFLQGFKALTLAQWQADQGITAANKDAILQGMLQTYKIGVI